MIDSPPLLSIVIPHRNDPLRLARCLAALAPQRDGGVEVIVVDDGSDCAPVTPSWVRLIRQSQAGAGPARNRGVAAAMGGTLAFVDADCVPAPGFVARARLARRVTGGRIEMFDDVQRPGNSRTGPQAFEAALAFEQARSVRQGWAATANLVVPKALFQIVGPFRTGVAEDVDWCRRAGRQGHPPVFDPALIVGHPTRADWRTLSAKWRRLTDEGFALARERPLGKLGWALRIPLVCGAAVADLHRIASCRALSPVERMRAAVVMVRVRALRVRWMLAQLAQVLPHHRPAVPAPPQEQATIRFG
jgi:glycosyltransferase involved in cell wall biosynthesis